MTKLNISKVTTNCRHMVPVKFRHFEDGENKEVEVRVVYRTITGNESEQVTAELDKETTERKQLSRWLSLLVVGLPDFVDDHGKEAEPTYEFFFSLDFTV